MEQEEKVTGLPENAGRELKPGEVYKPILSPDKNYPEVNFRSVYRFADGHIIFSGSRLFRIESGTGV